MAADMTEFEKEFEGDEKIADLVLLVGVDYWGGLFNELPPPPVDHKPWNIPRPDIDSTGGLL